MSNRKRLLVVDNNAESRKALCSQLGLHGLYETWEAESGARAFQLAKKDYFDAFLLEVALPDMDGRELCKLMRREGIHSPIILVSDAAGGADVILGLDAGANDYVTKPFHLGVLLARLRAQIREHEISEDPIYVVAGLRFRPVLKRLSDAHNHSRVRLTGKEAGILTILMRAGNRTVSWERLLEELRRHTARVSARRLRGDVERLQRKLADGVGRPELLIVEDEGARLHR